MPAVTVLSTAHNAGDARLRRICTALAEHGLDVRLEALGNAADGPPGVAVSTRPPGSVTRRLVEACAAPWRVRSEAMVVVDPEVFPPAYAASRIRDQLLVVDVHEDYRALLEERPWSTPSRRRLAGLLVKLAMAAARRSDVTSVVDVHLPPAGARRRVVVRNLPRRGELPSVGPPGEAPRAVYIGDLRVARGLLTMLDAIHLSPGWSLDLVGGGAEAGAAQIRRWIAERNIQDRVRWHGRLPLPDAWALARGAWVGLCLLEPTPAYRATIPTKFWEYLTVGLPVLTTPLPRVVSLLEKAGAGHVVRTRNEVVATFRRWRENPESVHRLRVRAQLFARQNLDVMGDPFDELAKIIVDSLSERSRRKLSAQSRGRTPVEKLRR